MAERPQQRCVVPGIIERTYPATGDKRYVVRVRIKGHPTQTQTFKRLTDAKTWRRHTLADMEAGRVINPTEARRHTFGDLVDRYLRDALPHKKTKLAAEQRTQLQWWRGELGPYLLSDLTPARIAESRDKLAAGQTCRGRQRSLATVNRYMAALSHALHTTCDEWAWLEESPMSKVRRMRESAGRVRFLTEEERAALLAACRRSVPECARAKFSISPGLTLI